MTQSEVFGGAKWICANVGTSVPLIRRSFEYKLGERATLRILGLGTFVCYINGTRVSDEYFLPFTSKFENNIIPEGEELSGFRVYVTEYDITEYLKEGKNTLSVMLGEGFYTELRYYGVHFIHAEKKLIYSISVGDELTVSDGSEKFIPSFITRSGFHEGGEHDYRGWSDSVMLPEFDDTAWQSVEIAKSLIDTEYCFSDCPTDKIIRSLPVKKVYECKEYAIYDCGEGTSGYPIVYSREGFSGEVKIDFSEILNSDGTDLDEAHIFTQHVYATVDGARTEIYPRFTWFGFRYFRISGEADCSEVKVVHTDIKPSSSFDSDNEVLNWLYRAYINTQLTNIHRGIPSDCPHLERFPYTGDGQLVAKSAMLSLDAKSLYNKWIRDIADCQDKISGRVQYTAPCFANCGGGPGGWGCAIVVIPYEFYKIYGDDKYIRELYPQMLEFLRFLEEHSDSDLVTSFKEGSWCLGDWCAPERWELPAPFINTYFRILSTERIIEIARIIGKDEDVPRLESDIKKCKAAINKFYYNSFRGDDCYCANYRGANAFALAIGLGTDVTRKKFIEHYKKECYYDTGIFGTEVVTRMLFELGEADTAFELLTASEPWGYGKWQKDGRTTLLEYWTLPSRSHSHPMFGGPIATLFEYILGIRQSEQSAGYSDVIISPAYIKELSSASGHITTPNGKISVSYKTEGNVRTYDVEIPEGIPAKIILHGKAPVTVVGGKHSFSVAE